MSNTETQKQELANAMEKLGRIDDAGNQQLIEQWKRWRMRDDIAVSTIAKEAIRLVIIAEYAEKPLTEMSSTEINNLVDDIKDDRDLGQGTHRNYGKAVRALYKSYIASLNEQSDPEERRHHEEKLSYIALPKEPDSDELSEDEVVEREDIAKLINHAPDIRAKAFLGALWEGGFRAGAICSVRIGDYNDAESGDYSYIEVPDKEGIKTEEGTTKPLLWSSGYIDRYLQVHPERDDPAAFLFGTKGRNQYAQGREMNNKGVYDTVKRACERTPGVDTDKIHPHSFRYGRATNLARQGHTEREIESILGWDEETDQHSRYEDLADADVTNAYLDAVSVDVQNQDSDPDTMWECPRCTSPVLTGVDYCPTCSHRLSDDMPLWFRTFRRVTGNDHPLVQKFDGRHPHHDPAKLQPSTFQNVQETLFKNCFHVLHEDLNLTPASIEVVGKRRSGALVCLDPASGLEKEEGEKVYERIYGPKTLQKHVERYEDHYRYEDDDFVDVDDIINS